MGLWFIFGFCTVSPYTTNGENYRIFENGKFVSTSLDQEPSFLKKSFKIQYPNAAARNKISGTVITEIIINEKGFLEKATIKKSLGYGCDQEALQFIQLISSEPWTPAIKNNKAIKVKFNFPIHFKL